MLVFVSHAHFCTNCRNYACTIQFKFGQNISITINEHIYPINCSTGGWNNVATIQNNIATTVVTLCCAKNRRCESLLVTSPQLWWDREDYICPAKVTKIGSIIGHRRYSDSTDRPWVSRIVSSWSQNNVPNQYFRAKCIDTQIKCNFFLADHESYERTS